MILTLWSLIQRWGGCAWNDTIDQDLDRQIVRTKGRPIPRGAISTFNAILFTAFLFLCGLSLVLTMLPIQCVTEACIILFFALLYPFGKRFTNYPQLTLANIGWAIPMSMHSMGVFPLDHLPPTVCMFMFIAMVVIMVDVLYARQDLDEDMKVGVKSMAVHFRDSIWTLIYSLFFGSTAMLIAAGVLAKFGLPFFSISVGGHFFGFMVLLQTSEQEPSSRMEWYAKSSLLFAMTLWIVGLVMELCIDL
jgi:4-hydroxybenzoate polyprenyltransferase